MKPLDILIAITVPIVWGLGLVFAKPAVDQFPPILLMALRFSVSALLLVWFVRIPRGKLKWLFVAALIGSTLQYGLTFNGLKMLDASTTALIVQSEAPFLTLVAAIFLGERLRLKQILGMAIAFGGIYLISGEPRIQGQGLGVALVLSGAFIWAIGQTMVRRLGEIGGMTAIAWVSVFAAPQLFVASALVERGQVEALANAPLSVWATVLYLGLVMTALGYTCWYHVLGRYEVYRVAPFLLMTPVASVLGGALLLGEAITATILLGGAIIISGVALLVIERRPVIAAPMPAPVPVMVPAQGPGAAHEGSGNSTHSV
ncbi:MAG: EamA family transporter [Hyphomicrobiales bacterium]|nr:MAG: EamA family transporter [Hyphomicrobiales bacterium]